MRKFLMVAAVGALALLMAVPASALDFKFSGEYRVRFYNAINVTFDETASANNQVTVAGVAATAATGSTSSQKGAQIRVRPRFDVSDDNGNIQAVLRLEIGDIEFGNGGGAHGITNTPGNLTAGSARIGNGSGGAIGNDGVNVETKWAYVDFAMPWGVPARVRAGIQPWYTPKGILVDDDVAGVKVYGKYNILSWDLAWYRASGGPLSNGATNITTAGAAADGGVGTNTTTGGFPLMTGSTNTSDNNYDFYQVSLNAALAKAFNPGLYYIYGDNRTNCTVNGASVTLNATTGATTAPASCNARVRTDNFIGLTVTGDLGFMKYDFDWIYSMMEGGLNGAYGGAATPTDVQGWAVDAGAHIPFGPVIGHLLFSYATGDKGNGGKSEAFGFISPSWNGAGGMYELVGAAGTFDPVEFSQDYMTNLWMLGAGLEYRPVKALWLRGMWGYAGFSNKLGNCSGKAAGTCYGPSYAGPATDPIVGKSALGQEISFRADYDIWTGFKVQAAAGWFIPSAGDTAHEYILQLLYNF